MLQRKIDHNLVWQYNSIFQIRFPTLKIQQFVFIGFGGNFPKTKKVFHLCISQIKQHNQIKLCGISAILKNPPFGFVDQDDYYNCVIAIKTTLAPHALLSYLQHLERRFGRVGSFKNSPRIIDLDIISYYDHHFATKRLVVPHPYYKKRLSVILPFMQLVPIKNTISREPLVLKKKVLVAMSGGIDSSLSAWMLQKEGYIVEGVYMKLHNATQGYHEQNLEAVAKVANYLGIKYHILEAQEEFNKEVFDYFLRSYQAGITPNPCVKCNQTIKFGVLFAFMQQLGADFLATGHYVATDGAYLYEAQDKSKDQSYFLAQVKKEVLPFLIFPLSKYRKEEVKKIGSQLPAFQEIVTKKESQEICFVPAVYTDTIKEFLDIDCEGDVVDFSGKVIGKHKGYMHYTIGKRRGFTLEKSHEPHFITKIDASTNTLVVGAKKDLAVCLIEINGLNMFCQEKVFECCVKLRYRSHPVQCEVTIFEDSATVKLFEPAFGVAAGQVAVFYDASKVLGSGWIINTSE